MKKAFKNMDPSEIESRYSNEKQLLFNSENTRKVSYEDLEPFIDRLPKREIDLINMYHNSDKKQKEIAEFFGLHRGLYHIGYPERIKDWLF